MRLQERGVTLPARVRSCLIMCGKPGADGGTLLRHAARGRLAPQLAALGHWAVSGWGDVVANATCAANCGSILIEATGAALPHAGFRWWRSLPADNEGLKLAAGEVEIVVPGHAFEDIDYIAPGWAAA
jgi:hypothetical protein